ncbi:uncharacterized protein At1g26090, chloroplastic [Dendrobium catenatum]|uniref:Uncharacterized protein n=1 Tax=Dendrobium catenatum TaxID=906689 RepID=A0A2I0WP46_9ASPA|nr:uncharacterized protein At1g26090, chloroplastic [Dendrobium catenatum]PKU77434.1 Uncharacterized protein MA16_Dca025543 [Dendrobium catenatum]
MELSALSPSSAQWLFSTNPKPTTDPRILMKRYSGWRIQASMADSGESFQKHTKIVTFLGKGGSGKSTAAVLAAKLFAREGLQTCLVIHSQDITIKQLMGCTIGNSPTMISENLYAVQLQTSKMLLEPLDRVKKVDVRMNLTQGILEGVVGEELGVLPGMDSIFSSLALLKYGNVLGSGRNYSKKKFDIVIYDGSSSEDTLRLVGATERVRCYLKYIRNLAEKTDIGRLTAPSFLRLFYESAMPNSGSVEGKTSADIWNGIEQILEEASAYFCDSSRFRCYLLMDPIRPLSVISALRYWGCAIQAGTKIYGAFGFAQKFSSATQETTEKISPLCFALLPYISSYSSLDWDVTLKSFRKDASHLLLGSTISLPSSVLFDRKQKSVTLFLPGFDKSDINLYQYRGGTELLIEAGDQRRIIQLPLAMQGKVASAKFIERNLVVTLR